MTARCYINRICSTAWFVAPREIKIASTAVIPDQQLAKERIAISPQNRYKLRPIWQFVIWGEESESIDWSLFGSAEKTSTEAENVDGEKKAEVERRSPGP
jgi:hypothetical protein